MFDWLGGLMGGGGDVGFSGMGQGMSAMGGLGAGDFQGMTPGGGIGGGFMSGGSTEDGIRQGLMSGMGGGGMPQGGGGTAPGGGMDIMGLAMQNTGQPVYQNFMPERDLPYMRGLMGYGG